MRPELIKVNKFARDLKIKVEKAEQEKLEFVDKVIQDSIKVSQKLNLGMTGRQAFKETGKQRQSSSDSLSSFAKKLEGIDEELQQSKPK